VLSRSYHRLGVVPKGSGETSKQVQESEGRSRSIPEDAATVTTFAEQAERQFAVCTQIRFNQGSRELMQTCCSAERIMTGNSQSNTIAQTEGLHQGLHSPRG
jgi:hypothetical protein